MGARLPPEIWEHVLVHCGGWYRIDLYPVCKQWHELLRRNDPYANAPVKERRDSEASALGTIPERGSSRAGRWTPWYATCLDEPVYRIAT